MSPDPFARLAPDEAFRTVVEHPSPHALGPLTASPLHARLLRLAMCRLREGLTPPRSYYWWNNGDVPARLDTHAI